jgi:hypothetical protein
MKTICRLGLSVCAWSFAVLAAGCAPRQPVACDQILDAGLRAAPSAGLAEDRFAGWVRDNYPGGDLYGVGEASPFLWKQGVRQYRANFEPGGLLISAELRPQPTVDEVVACLGKPEAYELRTLSAPDGTGVRLALWYPGQGAIFSYVKYGAAPPVFGGKSVLSEATVFAPGTIDQVTERFYAGQGADALRAALQAWPEKFEDMAPSE